MRRNEVDWKGIRITITCDCPTCDTALSLLLEATERAAAADFIETLAPDVLRSLIVQLGWGIVLPPDDEPHHYCPTHLPEAAPADPVEIITP